MAERWFEARPDGAGWTPAAGGWALIVGLATALAVDFVRLDAASRSASETLIVFFPHLGAALFVLLWACVGLGETLPALRGRRWFRAKRFGWGWTPETWEGWLVVAYFTAWTVIPTMAAAKLRGELAPLAHPAWLAHVAVMLTAFVGICWCTGERPGRSTRKRA